MVTEAIRSEPLAPSPEFCARVPLPACREPTKAGSDLPNCRDLARMSDAQLAQHDIAAVNLACAAGLPGAEVIDLARCLGTLDAWAAHVRLKTEVGACRFRQDPARWDGSRALFRVHCLVSVLQLDFGVRYRRDRMAPNAAFTLEDCFVHGILAGKGGTCASLPVIYAAVGRRLGYPLRLVTALGPSCGHRFLRWDEPGGQRFNIEINNAGFDAPPDDYYRSGLYAATRQWETTAPLLRSLTPRQELACFLADRAGLWLDAGNHREAADSYIRASLLDPANGLHVASYRAVLRRWRAKLRTLLPPAFPLLDVEFPGPRYPGLPLHVERDVLALEAIEKWLADPAYRKPFREPQGPYPDQHPLTDIPTRLVVRLAD
jgi:hypothetical protein